MQAESHAYVPARAIDSRAAAVEAVLARQCEDRDYGGDVLMTPAPVTIDVAIDAAHDAQRCYTPVLLARRWRCDVHKPLAFIHAGELIAVNIGSGASAHGL